MRALGVALILLTVPLVGCLGGDQAPVEATEDEPLVLNAPVLEPGQSWTYRASGHWDLVDRFTVVVAQADEEGYLLAGQAPQDLVGEVHLDRAWFGQRDLELNREPTDMHPEGWHLFDFPLYDGKTWYRGEQEVKAHETTVITPWGPERGFEMTLGGPGDGFEITYTYAPSLGYLASYTYEWNGRPVFDISISGHGQSATWAWYDQGDVHELTGGRQTDAQPMELEDGWDEVVVYAGGSEGTRAVVSPPAGPAGPWTYSVDGKHEAFVGTRLEATPGTWTLGLDRPADGQAYLALVPVSWEEHAL